MRSKKNRRFGSCVGPYAVPFMFALIRVLQTKQSAGGNRMVLILGNHDIANFVPGGSYCRRYTPTCVGDDMGIYETCVPRSYEYSKRHRENVQRSLLECKAVACLLIVVPDGAHILCMHGYVSEYLPDVMWKIVRAGGGSGPGGLQEVTKLYDGPSALKI